MIPQDLDLNSPNSSTPPASGGGGSAAPAPTPDAAPAAASTVTPPAATPPVSGTVLPATPSAAAGGDLPPPGAAVLPVYTPNYKIKVAQEDKEMDEIFRALVKDPESEKAVRSVLEKAGGLPHVQQRFQEFKTQTHEPLVTAHKELTQQLRQVGEFFQHEDFDSAFAQIGVSEEKVVKWVIDKLKYQQATPEEQRAIDDRQTNKREAVTLRSQNQTTQNQIQAQAVQNRTLEMRLALSSPDLAPKAQHFDSILGTGEFEKEIRRTGKTIWDETGKDVPPEQVAGLVLQRYAKVLATSPGPATAVEPGVTPPAAGQNPAQPSRKPPVIPSVSGGGQSPTKATVKTIEDLEALGRAAQARLSARS